MGMPRSEASLGDIHKVGCHSHPFLILKVNSYTLLKERDISIRNQETKSGIIVKCYLTRISIVKNSPNSNGIEIAKVFFSFIYTVFHIFYLTKF